MDDRNDPDQRRTARDVLVRGLRARRLTEWRLVGILLLVSALLLGVYLVFRPESAIRVTPTVGRVPPSTVVGSPTSSPLPTGTSQPTVGVVATSPPQSLPMCSPAAAAIPPADGTARESLGVVDQTQRRASNWTAGQTVGLDQTVGQVFTAGLSGQLTGVWLGLWSAGVATPGVVFPDVIVEISAVDLTTGLPTHALLAQSHVPNTTIPANGDAGVLVTFNNPVTITAGGCYLIVARSADPDHGVACCSWSFQPALGSDSSGDPYVGGTMLIQYADQPFYYPFDLSDMTFETYVRQE